MSLNKSRIDWCTHTWNPVTGCRHNCEYCYARRFAMRFGAVGNGKTHELDEAVFDTGSGKRAAFPFGFDPTLHRYRLSDPSSATAPRRIFVCSMSDLFGDWVPDEWIQKVFDACKAAPQHTYMFLTKNPKRYTDLANAGLLPAIPNFWYGTTVTEKGAPFFGEAVRYNTFLSIEPLMEDLDSGLGSFGGAQWIIIGAMTGPGSEDHRPRRKWVENIVEAAGITHATVFMKENLSPVWGPDLIQEYPKSMM